MLTRLLMAGNGQAAWFASGIPGNIMKKEHYAHKNQAQPEQDVFQAWIDFRVNRAAVSVVTFRRRVIGRIRVVVNFKLAVKLL
jgi:hypothetical protein